MCERSWRERVWKGRKQACHVHKSDREIQWRRQGRRGTTVYICIANAYYSIKIALLRVLNWSGQLSETRTRAHTHTHTHWALCAPTGTRTRNQCHSRSQGNLHTYSVWHTLNGYVNMASSVGIRALAGPLIQLQSRCHSKTHINVSYKLW